MDARSHRCQDIVDEGAAGRVGGGHISGSVPIDSRDGGSDQSLVSEADVATFHGGERPEEVAPDIPAEPELVAGLPRNVTLRMALVTLDEVDPVVVFQRAVVMKSVLHFLSRPFPERVEIGVGRSFLGQLSRR